MNKVVFSVCVALLLALMAPALFATTATDLSSFQYIEEPKQVCTSSGCQSDSYVNITESGGIFRFYLRYNSSSWDGDQSSNRTDRQRAEIRALGTHQTTNQTFDYSSQWRTSSTLRGTSRFTHIFQLKAYDGTMGPPVVTVSLNNGVGSAVVQSCSGSCSSGLSGARNISWQQATWQTLLLRIKVSTSSGELRASVNGDALSGRTGIPLYLSGSTDYQPKWGLYRGIADGIATGYIERQNIMSNRVDGGATPTPTAGPTATPTPTPIPTAGPTATPTPTPIPGGGSTWEAEALSYAASGASAAMQSDASATGGTWLALLADGSGDYIQFTTPSLAAGTYSVSLRYKAHSSRGILQASVDGANLGGTLDQYAATAGFASRTFGTVTLAAGSHTLRLTCTGRNASSAAYTLSADTITLTASASPTPTPTPTPVPGVTPTPTPTPGSGGVSFEAESVAVTNSGTGTSVQTDANCSGGQWVSLDAENTGSWFELTTPSIPAGTYTLRMKYKTNNNRGQLTMAVDGVAVGGTVDQYGSPSTYPTATFGTVTFGATGTHKLRMTAVGKNASSTSYVLSADAIILE